MLTVLQPLRLSYGVVHQAHEQRVIADVPLTRFSSPEDVVRVGLAAHVAGEWRTLAGLVDTPSLDRWRDGFVHGNTHIRSLDEWRAEIPDVTDAQLATFAERMAVPIRAFVARLSDHIAGVSSLEELARLSSADVLVGILEADDHIAGLNRATEAAYLAAGIERPASTFYSRPDRRFDIVRLEDRSESSVAVVFREEAAPAGLEGTWMVSRGATDDWRLTMSGEILHLPGGNVTYIDDPVVLAFVRRHEGLSR